MFEPPLTRKIRSKHGRAMEWSLDRRRSVSSLEAASSRVGQANSEAVSFMKAWHRESRFPASWASELTASLANWLHEQAEFAPTKAKLSDLMDQTPKDTAIHDLVGLRKVISSAGFFSLGPPLLADAIRKRKQDRLLRMSRHPAYVRASLLNEDFTASTILSAHPWFKFAGEINHYLKLVNGSFQPSGPPSLVIGPSTPDPSLMSTMRDHTVCRVLIPTSEQVRPLSAESTDAYYLNGLTAHWIQSLDTETKEKLFSTPGSIYAKNEKTATILGPKVGVAVNLKPIYFTGSPNMIPIIAVDQLLRGAGHVHVTGTTFFLGDQPYHVNSRRVFSESEHESDAFGSTGTPFERCRAIAAHDQAPNRMVVRHLMEAGLVSGDADFTRALLLSELDYFSELEQTYGKHRK